MRSINMKAGKKVVLQTLHHVFLAGQRLGFDILPRHFYSNIPDIRELRRSDSWRRPGSMVGIDGTDLDRQIKFIEDWCPQSRRDLLTRAAIHEIACKENGATGYGTVESDLLYCFIIARKPNRIIQVGAGVATSVMLQAASAAGYAPEIVCVEPYPNPYLRRLAAERKIELLALKAQEVEISTLTSAGPRGFLFVDSTHTTKPGSEVNRIILEVLPRLDPGCYVHFHDIYFPYDYQCDVLNSVFFWGESSLLHAFLIHNARYSIATSLSMLHHGRSEELRRLMPNYRPATMDCGLRISTEGPFERHDPSSIYLQAL